MWISQEFLEEIALTYGVSDKELEVLSRALNEGSNLDEIARRLGIQPQAARKRLGEVYKKFGIRGRGPGKLAQLQQRLMTEYQKQQQPVSSPTLPAEGILDWGCAPEVESSYFYGRQAELRQLQQYCDRNDRLIAIYGMAGMGKTWLSVRWVQTVESQFDFIIWRSLRHKPTLSELLSDLLEVLFLQTSPASKDINGQISQLMNNLREKRGLIVLDDLEDIFGREKLAGHYASGFEEYGDFFERIATERHGSCILLISSEKLTDWVKLEGAKVKSLKLEGSTEIAREILKEKEIEKTNEWEELIKLHQGNPFAVKMVASILKNLYQNRVGEFLKPQLSLSASLSQSTYLTFLLEQEFERFAEAEKYLAYWLAIQKKPTTTKQLQEFYERTQLEENQLLSILSSLDRRSLLEKSNFNSKTVFSLPRLIRRYFSNHLVQSILQGILQLIHPIPQEISPILNYYPVSDSLDSAVESLLPQLTEKLAINLQKNPKNLDALKSAIAQLKKNSTSDLKRAIENLELLVVELEKS
ncbi:MAG: NB-ARC domain-containing protein [Cyanobacteriota bacterium]|nr:NB-ARC domain-containing protein [Cyanobacteriota bacterium]